MGDDIMIRGSDEIFTVRSVALVLCGGRILLARAEGTPYYLVGGAVKLGENSVEAIKRELREETGIYIAVRRLVFLQERVFKSGSVKHHEIALFYEVQASNEIARIENASPTDAAGYAERLYWHPIDRLNDIDLVPLFLKDKLAIPLPGFEHIIVDETK